MFLTLHSHAHTRVEAVLPCKVLAFHWQPRQVRCLVPGLWLAWGTSHSTNTFITEQAEQTALPLEPHVLSKETEYKENSKVLV